VRWPAALPWWLALWGALALLWWSRLATLVRDELDPLAVAGAAVPIHPQERTAHTARWGQALAVLTALASEVLT
jgi:hypothetical protein